MARTQCCRLLGTRGIVPALDPLLLFKLPLLAQTPPASPPSPMPFQCPTCYLGTWPSAQTGALLSFWRRSCIQ